MRNFRRALVVVAALGLTLCLLPTAPAEGAVHAAPKPKVVQSGFTFVAGDEDDTFAGDVTAAAVVENATGKVAVDVDVTFILEDGRGRKIMDSRYSIAYIAPGAEAYAVWTTTYPETRVPASVSTKLAVGEMLSPRAWSDSVQYEFSAGDLDAEPVTVEDVALEFSDLRYHDSTQPGEGLTGGLASSVVGTVRAISGQELTGLEVSCAAFEDGEVVGGGSGPVTIIAAGTDAGLEANGFLGGLAPDEVRCSGRIEHLYGRVGPLDAQVVTRASGFSTTTIDDYVMGAVIENPSDLWAWAVDVGFDVLDADGRVIGSRQSSGLIYIAPRSATYVVPGLAGHPGEYAGTPASLRVLPDAGRFGKPGKEIKTEAGFDPAGWSFDFSDVALDGEGHVTGTITSRAEKPLDALSITCGLYRGGAMVGAATEAYDESELGGGLRPGSSVAFELGVALESTGADDIRCVGSINEMSDV